jgi:hypothetical protein
VHRALTLTLIVGGACARDRSTPSAACEASPGVGEPLQFLDLRVHFEGQAAVASKQIRIITYDNNDSERVYAMADAVVDATGTFEQHWVDAYRRYEYQPIVYYVDVDGDGECTADVDVGDRHISSAWNPVGDAMLDQDLAVFPLKSVTHEVCSDLERCFR